MKARVVETHFACLMPTLTNAKQITATGQSDGRHLINFAVVIVIVVEKTID
jgi:hypothetical protein